MPQGMPVSSMLLWQLCLTHDTNSLPQLIGQGVDAYKGVLPRNWNSATPIPCLKVLELRRNKKSVFRGGKTEQSRLTEKETSDQVNLSQPQVSICPQYCPLIPGIFAFLFPKCTFAPIQTPALPCLLTASGESLTAFSTAFIQLHSHNYASLLDCSYKHTVVIAYL